MKISNEIKRGADLLLLLLLFFLGGGGVGGLLKRGVES
jgi:hypothetical protein